MCYKMVASCYTEWPWQCSHCKWCSEDECHAARLRITASTCCVVPASGGPCSTAGFTYVNTTMQVCTLLDLHRCCTSSIAQRHQQDPQCTLHCL